MIKIITVFLLVPFLSFSQVRIKNQPPSDWYLETNKLHQQNRIKGEDLLKIKSSPFPDSFQDTLRKYDWIELGGYLHVDKHLSSGYDDLQPNQYSFIRLTEKDTVENFSFYKSKSGESEVTHTNFKDTYWMLPTYVFKKIGTSFFIEVNSATSSKEYIKLVSYSNGMLVYDIPMNGKTTDVKMFSRRVLMAREKKFTWQKNE